MAVTVWLPSSTHRMDEPDWADTGSGLWDP